jgi:hypothetical protein
VGQGRLEDHEPQDLTPMQDVGQMSGGMSSSPDTPGKKDRNSRKQCPYCTKGQPVNTYHLPFNPGLRIRIHFLRIRGVGN